MNEEIKRCVEARVNMFDQYYTIPADMEIEVKTFIDDINKLGNSCSSANTFEEKFVSTGLSDRFMSILPKCTPKAVKMTKEQKQEARSHTKEMLSENSGELIKDTAKGIGDQILTRMETEVIDQNRKRMIDNGTFDDYARASNARSDAEGLFKFFKNKFGNKSKDKKEDNSKDKSEDK